jgi:hypothetical protein
MVEWRKRPRVKCSEWSPSGHLETIDPANSQASPQTSGSEALSVGSTSNLCFKKLLGDSDVSGESH